MKKPPLRIITGAAVLLLGFILHGCTYAVVETDQFAGFNGGFEIAKSGYPVNWAIYSPEIIKKGDVTPSLDTDDPIEGRQALKLVVRRTNPIGGWRSAGIFKSVAAKEGTPYKVSFWIKNQGCKFRVTIRNEGKDPFFGFSEVEEADLAAHPPVKVLLSNWDTGTDEWRQFVLTYTVPETDGSIRFELNIERAGTLWIDDVRIEEVRMTSIPLLK